MDRLGRLCASGCRGSVRRQPVAAGPTVVGALWRHAPAAALRAIAHAAPTPTPATPASARRSYAVTSAPRAPPSPPVTVGVAASLLESTLVRHAAAPSSGDPARWQASVRALVQLRHLAMQPTHTSSDASDAHGQLPTLTLDHFHSVLRCLLSCIVEGAEATMKTNTPAPTTTTAMRYPSHMLASSWTNELLRSFVGVEPKAGGPPRSASSTSPPVEVLEALQVDLPFYHTLLERIEHSLRRPTPSQHGMQHSMNASSPGIVPNLNSPHGVWMLVVALEATRKPMEPAAGVSPTALPPLALVRHLFNGITEVGVRPTRQTINLILAIHDAHGRATDLSQGHQSSPATAPPSRTSADADDAAEEDLTDTPTPDVDYVWELWNEMERAHAVHPDLLSQLLMLRICYRHRQYGHMARLLAESQVAQDLLAIAEPMLHHSFASPHLLLSALTHSSQVASRIDSNERMEFLGDSVLDVLVREMLVERAARQIGLQVDCVQADEQSAPVTPAHALHLDVSSPDFLRSDYLPTPALAQLKGKFVSHRSLASCSRALGLSALLLQANQDVRSSVLGWQEKKERKRRVGRMHHQQQQTQHDIASKDRRKAARRRWEEGDDSEEHMASASPSDDLVSVEPVPDNLAEDVFEACLAALYLDSADPTVTGVLPDPDAQVHGIAAARDFLRRSLGGPLLADVHAALAHHDRSHAGDSPSRRVKHGKAHVRRVDSVFDRRLNYKLLLELWVRGMYTDDVARRCHAHILYVCHGQMGAHLHRVRVVIRVLPEAVAQGRFRHSKSSAATQSRARRPVPRQIIADDEAVFSSLNTASSHRHAGLTYLEFLAAQEKARVQTAQSDASPDASAPSSPGPPSASAPFPDSFVSLGALSFSVSPSQVPVLNSSFDREFPLILEQPELSTAEQMAAFVALKKIGVLHQTNLQTTKRKREGANHHQHQPTTDLRPIAAHHTRSKMDRIAEMN